MAPLSPRRRLTAKRVETHDKMQEGFQQEEAYEALMDLREEVAEDPRDMTTACPSVRVTEMEGMAGSSLGLDAQEASATATTSRR